MTPQSKLDEQRRVEPIRRLARASVPTLCDAVHEELRNHLSGELHRLADCEVLSLSRNGEQTYRMARTLLLATGTAQLEAAFNCKDVKPGIKKAKRWLNNRCE